MKIRKKFSLAILFSVAATVGLFMDIKGAELTAYGIIAGSILAAFGYMDVKGKDFE